MPEIPSSAVDVQSSVVVDDDEPPDQSPHPIIKNSCLQGRRKKSLSLSPIPVIPRGKNISETDFISSPLVRKSAWSSWRWQLKNRIRSFDELSVIAGGCSFYAECREAAARFPMAITPYYFSLIRSLDDSDPVFAMSVPQPEELVDPPFLLDDPLEEDRDMPVPGLVHRYPDRALLLATTVCAMYCRHCTRKRVAGQKEKTITASRLRLIVKYISEHPEIHDVIISGGDPFTMSTQSLEQILKALRSVPTVEVIRIGTRTPVTLPMRIDDELAQMLRRYAPLFVNTHFNHPVEITPESASACARLVDAGIPVGNQSVLLRGVNDSPEEMEALLRYLVRIRVRPYYLYQCDLVRGVERFRTPVSRGIEIMEYLRGRLSGIAIPTYVVDAPGGGGKIPVLPNYIISISPTHTVLRNFEGMIVSYPEPVIGQLYSEKCRGTISSGVPAVSDLSSGTARYIRPELSVRHIRRRISEKNV